MYTEKKIKSQLSGLSSSTLNKNFIGFIVTIDEKGVANHSGLIICFLGKIYLFHYLPKGVFLEEIDLDKLDFNCYYKEITIIDKKLIRAFLMHCKIVKATSTPTYGFFISGSYYENGVYHTEDTTPQLMTCVGFCINVITGFLEEKAYIEFTDWIEISKGLQDWFDNFLVNFKNEFPEVDEASLRKNLRRIKPSELISSGYFGALPIRKIQTDQIKPVIEHLFKLSI
ncbi:MAG: hypothetical protein EOO42_00835 [Flavobacteriales bacterium]|nr:MAG: hypothetical protein EOO42_00835 [Flavobacteriales bacterium]